MKITRNDDDFNIWVGLRASDFQMFDQIIRINQVISIDDDYTKGTPLLSREILTKRRTIWGNEELLAVSRLKNFRNLINEIMLSKKRVNVYCYHTLPIFERIAKKNKNIRIFASSINLKRRLDDKFKFSIFLKKLGIPSIYSLKVKISNSDFKELSQKLGLPFIIKLRIGASGSQTYLVRNENDLTKLKNKLQNNIVIASKYIIGHVFNINAFINKDVYLSQPSIQLVGIPECSSEKFTYCGNDYYAFSQVSKTIKNEVLITTKKIGMKIEKLGYYGIFGTDFIYDIKNKVLYPLEINPRMQGSTPLLMRYQLSRKLKRLTELYCCSRLIPYNYNINASFVLIHNLSRKNLKIKRSFASGIYKYKFLSSKLKLKYLSNKYPFPRNKNELLILGCPKVDTIVEPGASILRIEFLDSVLNRKNNCIKKLYSKRMY